MLQLLEELIDTQWDVNNYAMTIISIMDDELIDTQWDVNSLISFITATAGAN